MMVQTVIKLIASAVLIVVIAEVAKRTILIGALLASLPLTSLLAMIWLYVDTGDTTRVADLASGIFWLVLPSLALFLVLPALLRSGYSFWTALGIGCLVTFASYAAEIGVLRLFGIRLS
jgi:hypothetical protein